jgi:hypothetical protein
MIILSTEEKARFEQWIIENVSEKVVPNDEGNNLALIFNLVHLLRGDGQTYNYLLEQDTEIESWNVR